MELVYLFVPGNSERKIEKSLNSNADVIIIDLEDAVQSNEKFTARKTVIETLGKLQELLKEKKVHIRINSITTPWFFDDLKLINEININGIMVPKCENGMVIKVINERVKKQLEIIPLIETATGVLNCGQIIQSSPDVKKVAFGSVDFALDLGTDWTEAGEERKHAMGQIVLESRVFGAEAPIDAVFPVINDEKGFIKDTEYGKTVGFFGKMIIHPKQIEWLHKVYQPTSEKIEWSRKVVASYESADQIGAIELDGKLIDLPVYQSAKRILSTVK